MPFITMSMPIGSLPKTDLNVVPTLEIVSSKTQYLEGDSVLALNQAMEAKEKLLDLEGDAIDSYFSARKMPLAGTGRKMAEEADKNDLDWRLLPAIAVRESTGGKHACKKVPHSFFGWGSCKIGFKSEAEAIEIVAKHLGGGHENTAHYYSDKTVKEILQRYNPPSVVPDYAEQVMKIMDSIGDAEIIVTPDKQVSSYGPLAQIG